MKAATLLFVSLLYILSPGNAQAQCTIQTWVSYSVSDAVALNAAGTDIITSVLLDGSAGMQMIATGNCPDSIITAFNNNKQNIQHWPSVLNRIGLVGGWSQGPPSCAECYISYQTNMDSGPANSGTLLPFTYEGQTYCGMAGIVFFPPPTNFQLEVATTMSIRLGPSVGGGVFGYVTPIGQYCDMAHYPPDFNPPFADTFSSSAGFFIGSAVCVRLGPGWRWVCSPGLAAPLAGTPSSTFPCTHNP